jgi:hypothetical protein
MRSIRFHIAAALAAALASPPFIAFAEEPIAPTGTPSQARPAGGGLTNPDIGLDGLFALAHFNRENPVTYGGHDPKATGFNLQQVELSFASNVDPYLRADANIVLLASGIEIEEAYATTLGLPWGFQLKAGQFLTAVGRHNPTHPHAWGWANRPLVMGRFFGGDGLRNPGAQLSWLSPLPWYSELVVSAQNSTGETAASFLPDGSMHSLAEDALYLGRWSNFFAVTDSFSTHLGATYLQGANPEGHGKRTRFVAGDIYLKYRQPDSLSFFALQAEAIQRYYDSAAEGRLKDFGWYAELTYRLPGSFARWHVGLRYDQLAPKHAPVLTAAGSAAHSHGHEETEEADAGAVAGDPDSPSRFRVSPVVTYYPSEFSKVRLQYDYDRLAALEITQHAVILQFEFMIGAHASHKF